MKGNKNNTSKLTLSALILMIFTSVYGFNNIPRAFYLMGYSAIPWYILSAITFFIPYAFMMAEYGAAFRKEKGGIYSWMEKSVGPKYAFIGTFMWFASYLIWMVSVSSSIWVPLSNLIFGTDKTETWSLFGLNAPRTLAILGCIFIVLITFISSKGLKSIAKIASIGGVFVSSANIVLIIGALIVLVFNGFNMAQPISAAEFIHSPNPNYQTPLGILSFLVFALFAYGGLEAVGGLVDKTENPKVVFPRGIKIAALVIAVGYSLAILFVGFFINWKSILSSSNVNMANVSYIVIKNLGIELGRVFNLSPDNTVILGAWFARFIGLAMFLALTGAFFTLIYSPLKQLIEGTPSEIWPKRWTIKDENDMPVNAMWVQCIIVVSIILISSFGGKSAGVFLDYLILMGNVAMTIPYMFLSFGFIYFKRKKEIQKPFEIYKNPIVTNVTAIIVTFTVGFANFFTILQPALETKDYISTLFQLIGPLFFGFVGFLLYYIYEKKYIKNNS
ncbi:glutamate/gamma-aminobutyrate family transporter YjeM [Clostridium septicum]|uniref:glutamate/gamma-aminobutyrate family transporter YjeM n=1 Tax=Clostridium septicum TaxID=1504 RepID=UPI000B0BA04D|nr:glutamate/gamma-aminobutyrate family transporter YjeM [Clostridium septicum]MDU1314395.1 glutamate/gamma-aminobutyrate family transporter YjeM [Clostridium septicum]UEC22195.1 glutamate/gamma-aminobutyrate family transporter YjeM [Clostridium septicum]WLF68293.1 glutamate/gamma-aminobutyrate family transporter YjeM [Clostridium septicum]